MSPTASAWVRAGFLALCLVFAVHSCQARARLERLEATLELLEWQLETCLEEQRQQKPGADPSHGALLAAGRR